MLEQHLHERPVSRVLQWIVALFLLAGSVGLFYAGFMTWQAGPPREDRAATGTPGLPLFVFAATMAYFGILCVRLAIASDEADDDPVVAAWGEANDGEAELS